MGTLVVIVVAAIYGYGGWRFWKGFHRTNFSGGRLYLTALWPVFLFSASYRQNFSRALKG